MKFLVLLVFLFSTFAFATISVDSAKKSPSINHYGFSFVQDGSKRVPMLGVVLPDSSGVTNLNPSYYATPSYSSVTGLEDVGTYTLASGSVVPVFGLVSIDPVSRTPAPFASQFVSSSIGVVTTLSVSAAFFPPALTSTQRDAIATDSAVGMLIYNTTTSKHQGYNGTAWNDLY